MPTKQFSGADEAIFLGREEALKQSPGTNMLRSNNGVRPCGTSSSTCFTTSLARNTWPARGSNGDFVNCGLEERESLDWITAASQSAPWRCQGPVKSTLSPRFISRAATLTKCTDAEGGLADFGPLRDIVRS